MTLPASADDVTRPSVEGLIALRAVVARHRPARRARHRTHGPSLSPLRGRGMEYAESRDYVTGDDARHIDWRLTARTGRTHTKLFQAETERLTLVVVDPSPGLFFGTRQCFKSVQAARVAATALWRAVGDGDRVGLIVQGGMAPVRFATGPRAALPLMHVLAGALAVPGSDAVDLLANTLVHARRQLRHGARLVVVVDGHRAVDVPEEIWRQLQGVEVHVVLMTDPFEQAPPARRLPVQVAAVPVALALDETAVSARWQAHFPEAVAAFVQRARQAGVHVHAVSTTDAPEDWLRGFTAPQARVA